MSSYYDDDRRDDRRRDRGDRDRDRDRDRDHTKDSRRDRGPVYEETETLEARRGPARGGELIRRRHDSSESSVEEVQRNFPPGGDYRRRKDYGPRRARSHGGDRYDDDYDYRSRRKDKRREPATTFLLSGH